MTRNQVLLAVLVGAGCSTYPSSPPPPPPPPPPPGANAVNVTSNQFNPTSLTVTPNTTVTWNFSGGPHNVTFEDGNGNSGDKTSGTHTRNFGTAGPFRYRCTNHSTGFGNANEMVGTIQVN